jgi:hypothetical protein
VEGSIDSAVWIEVTNIVCNTLQIVALAWIGMRLQLTHLEVQRRNHE